MLYCAVFVALSLVTSRALVFGLTYVLIWEGLLSGLFAGTRTFSIRQHDARLRRCDRRHPEAESSTPSWISTTAVVVAAVVLVGATLLAIRRLGSFEISGEAA